MRHARSPISRHVPGLVAREHVQRTQQVTLSGGRSLERDEIAQDFLEDIAPIRPAPSMVPEGVLLLQELQNCRTAEPRMNAEGADDRG
jgi:hypothetical protein